MEFNARVLAVLLATGALPFSRFLQTVLYFMAVFNNKRVQEESRLFILLFINALMQEIG